ncbi:MAG: T9SS type A sorting domain-containing protein, partial [Hymenobacter sp.]|nr:T9SS type A sorting domain-containing protein [Hymenobacter sp.]
TAPGGGTTPPPTATYCASKGANVSYERIDLVRLGSLNRTSGADAGYYNGTALNTTVAAGSAQTISYSAGFASAAYTEYWKIYIDYNQDGDFTDSGELVASRSSGSSATLSSTFTVPAAAKSGKTRLRAVMSDNAATSSCGTYSYGETEDYSLTISGGTARTSARLAATDYGLYPNPATSLLTITVPADRDATTVSVRVYDVRGAEQRQVRPATDGQLDVSGLSKGIYLLTITDGQQVSHQRFVKE